MKRILVVDDEHMTRTLLRDILQPEGYDVLEAEDGRQALEIIAKEKLDLVITDRSMPGMGGMELLQTLMRNRPELPTLVVSAFGEDSLWGQAIALGARDYLMKPFDTNEVIKAVKKCLAGPR